MLLCTIIIQKINVKKNKVMKANEAPKKIYLDEDESWHLTNPNGDSVEYTRTDAFIEKAYEYLSYHLDTSKIDVNYKFEFIEEFKKAMRV